MGQIIKASFYKLKVSKALTRLIGISIVFMVVLSFLAKSELIGTCSAERSLGVLSGSISMWLFMGYMVVMVFIISFIGSDFGNKTLYYEVMGGHSRKQVYLGRLIACAGVAWLSWCMEELVVFIICYKQYTCIVGEGWQIILRLLGGMIIVLPYIGICYLGAFIGKNVIYGLAVSWILFLCLQCIAMLPEAGYTKYLILQRLLHIVFQNNTLAYTTLALLISLIETGILIGIGGYLFDKQELK